MKERPIIFGAPMVRAILDGRKMQTRRLATGANLDALTRLERELGKPTSSDEWGACFDNDGTGGVVGVPLPCRYGEVGDRLWVRETWSHDGPGLDAVRAAHEDAHTGVGYGPYYRATEVAPDTLRWITPIHMPRWASRITLEITEVRVQRLQEISEDDAQSEGCDSPLVNNVDEFAMLWDSINGKRAPWTSNPWVWAITFRRLP